MFHESSFVYHNKSSFMKNHPLKVKWFIATPAGYSMGHWMSVFSWHSPLHCHYIPHICSFNTPLKSFQIPFIRHSNHPTHHIKSCRNRGNIAMFVICQAPREHPKTITPWPRPRIVVLGGRSHGHRAVHGATTGRASQHVSALKGGGFRAEAWGVQGTHGMKHRCGEDVGIMMENWELKQANMEGWYGLM